MCIHIELNFSTSQQFTCINVEFTLPGLIARVREVSAKNTNNVNSHDFPFPLIPMILLVCCSFCIPNTDPALFLVFLAFSTPFLQPFNFNCVIPSSPLKVVVLMVQNFVMSCPLQQKIKTSLDKHSMVYWDVLVF